MFVPDLECAQRVFHLLDQFESCSGLKVNYSKTEAMWIGSSRQNTETPLGLKWCNSVKALGLNGNCILMLESLLGKCTYHK